jgi:nucleoside-diphosphate kinase
MATERTLSLIKPDAVEKNCIGKIITRFEDANLRVVAAKMIWLNKKDAEKFYSVHKGKHFFETLIQFITSGPLVALVLEGDNAILKNREIMGATDPRKALPGTIRGDFAKGVERMERNIVHGSDALETAEVEIPFFFSERKIFAERNVQTS